MSYATEMKSKYRKIVNKFKYYLVDGYTLNKMLNRNKEDFYAQYFPRLKGEYDYESFGKINDTYESAYANVHREINSILDEFSRALAAAWSGYATAKARLEYYTNLVEQEKAQNNN